MARDERKKLIKAIQQKRGSKVIVYVTGDRANLQTLMQGDAVPLLHEHILAIKPAKRSKLDLLIYSRGGDSDVPWTIVSTFREYAKEGSFGVLVPYRAHSAATMVSLGADEIIMMKKAELGPIDITMTGPYNDKDQVGNTSPISVEDVMGYFKLLDTVQNDASGPEQKMQGFQKLTEKVHPLALGSVSRLLAQTESVAGRLLRTRTTPYEETKRLCTESA